MIKADIFLQTNCMPLIVHSFIRKALPTTNARLCRTSYENSFKISLQSYQFDLWPNPCAIGGGNYPKRGGASVLKSRHHLEISSHDYIIFLYESHH